MQTSTTRHWALLIAVAAVASVLIEFRVEGKPLIDLAGAAIGQFIALMFGVVIIWFLSRLYKRGPSPFVWSMTFLVGISIVFYVQPYVFG